MGHLLFAIVLQLLNATMPYSIRMAESEIVRNPDAAMLDVGPGVLKWNYTTGLELLSMMDVSERYDMPHLWNYAYKYMDTIVNEKGEIHSYSLEKQNIDHICPGRVLFRVYDRTKENKFRKAMRMLYSQLQSQPRTSEGGFWHKNVYPHQMWLDGLYMGEPFYAEYVKRYGDKNGIDRKECFKDIENQFVTVAKHTYDPITGLYRHAWDESREMFWSDSLTGQSQHAWGRALGWYVMAIVETLDYMPQKSQAMIDILQGIYRTLPKYADDETGMWYQVLDSPEREGNYLESTCSAMFVYGMLKGIRCGYLDASMKEEAYRLYNQFIKTFVRENPDGTISITNCCSVAGLGGSNNRSGTFDYYISEPVIENDCKAVGPFIWASLEYEAAHNIDYAQPTADRPLAFEGAAGGGRYTTGGRGGKRLTVTSLADDGKEGTLRWAVEQEGPRIVTFDVEGIIALNAPLAIKNGDLTLTAQDAPGEGITLCGYGVHLNADNIIIRYLRFRMTEVNGVEADALDGQGHKDIIIDHCSISWSTDECASFYANSNFTMQWCILSESLNNSIHQKGRHGYGGIWGGRNATFHHNLLAHHSSRNPRLDHAALYRTGNRLIFDRGTVEFVNNVVYNWGFKACYGGESGWWNVINNYYKPGPGTTDKKYFLEVSKNLDTKDVPGSYYISGNILVGREEADTDNWNAVQIAEGYTRAAVDHVEPFTMAAGAFEAQTATQAYKEVLKHAGASAKRDKTDKRIIQEVKKGKTTFSGSVSGMAGLIDSVKDVNFYY